MILILQVVGFAADDKYRMKKKVSVADVYHSANRYSTGTRSLPVILPRSIAWSFAKQRPLLGRELLRCQGHSYDHDFLSSFTESQLGNLAGNAQLCQNINGCMVWSASKTRFLHVSVIVVDLFILFYATNEFQMFVSLKGLQESSKVCGKRDCCSGAGGDAQPAIQQRVRDV